MKRIGVLIALIAGLAVLVTGAAVALTDGDPVTAETLAQAPDSEAPDTESSDDDGPDSDDPDGADEKADRGSLLGDVLADLVAEGVITSEQAEIIEDRITDAKAEWKDEFPGKHRFHFRFPKGFDPDDLPEGFELPEGFPDDFDFEGFRFRGPIEVPDEVREQLEGLLDSLGDDFEVPFGGRLFRLPGSSLQEFLEDGQLSQDELDQLETELQDLAEQFKERYEERRALDEDANA